MVKVNQQKTKMSRNKNLVATTWRKLKSNYWSNNFNVVTGYHHLRSSTPMSRKIHSTHFYRPHQRRAEGG